MGKKKLTPAEAGKGQPTVASYYTVVEKPSENKNKEKPLETEEIALSAGNNDKSNDTDSTITYYYSNGERNYYGTQHGTSG